MHPEILVPSWTPSPAHDQSLLGQQLLQAGHLTQAQVSQALRYQRQTRLKFGEVCLERGWIDAETLYLNIPSRSLSLGEILVLKGDLGFDQLRVALAQQRRFGRRLGEILLWRGWLQDSELDEVLEIQRMAHSLQFSNAWEALHALHVFRASELEEGATEIGMSGSSHPVPSTPAESSEELSPITEPILPAQDEQTSPQVAALQLQLEMQQREWQAQTEMLEMQWNGAEIEYNQKIAQLEEQLRWQQQENKGQQQEIIQRYRRRVRSLEAQITELQAEQQHTLELLAGCKARIHSLEGELRSRQDHQDHHHAALHHRYQQQLQTLHSQWTQEKATSLHLESLNSGLNDQIQRLTTELQHLHPLAQQYHQVSTRIKPLTQALAQSRAAIQTLKTKLEQIHNQNQQCRQELKECRHQKQRLAAELTAAKRRIQALEASEPSSSGAQADQVPAQ